ncbi:MAG: hypothetical protein JRI87_09000, partial [Deltaproteobacteria bacterium]|nr:hypothetical protein [Deltaproteobacteria bacterium]
MFLASGMLCYIIAFFLFYFQKEITSSAPLTKLGFSLEILAEHLWSVPSALVITLFFLSISSLYYYTRIRGKDVRCLRWCIVPLSLFFMKCLLFFLFFIYTIFPLRWAQRSFTRAPESFPDYTPLFCCLYCFEKLPLKIVNPIEKVISLFYKWKERYFIGLLLIFCFLITSIIAYSVLDHIPHVLDSIAQLFQAKIFKMGKLYLDPPSQKEFFDYAHVINNVKWYSQYPPGHSLLLMLGLFFGVPWLIGPFLGTLSLFVFYLFIKNIYSDQRMTYLGATLLFLSPFFLFMSSSHMNHTSTLFFVVLFLYFYQRFFSSDSFLTALFSGLSLGYAITIRPLTAVAIGIPFIGNLLICSFRKRRVNIRALLAFFAGVSLMVFLLLFYNDLTNGSPFLFGYQSKYQTLGFLGNAQGGPPHTLKGGVINTSNNLVGINDYLFEWPIPSLIFIFLLFSTPIKKKRWDYLFLYASFMLILSYFFYYHQDYIYGPRFYYSLTPFMIILTVRGFLGIPHWLEKKRFNKRKIEASLYLLLLLCFLYTLSFSLPSLVKKYSDDYWWVTNKLHKTVKEQGITNAIVFIDCWHPLDSKKPHLIYYCSGFQFTSPDLKDHVIYALHLKDKNIVLM